MKILILIVTLSSTMALANERLTAFASTKSAEIRSTGISLFCASSVENLNFIVQAIAKQNQIRASEISIVDSSNRPLEFCITINQVK